MWDLLKKKINFYFKEEVNLMKYTMTKADAKKKISKAPTDSPEQLSQFELMDLFDKG